MDMICETTGTNTQVEFKEEMVRCNFRPEEYIKDD